METLRHPDNARELHLLARGVCSLLSIMHPLSSYNTYIMLWLVLSALLSSAASLVVVDTMSRLRTTHAPSRRILATAKVPEECMLMRVLFSEAASVESVLGLLRNYPFEALRNARTPDWSTNGLRLTFNRDEDSALYGGLAFAVAPAGARNPYGGPTLDVSRISEGLGEMAPVIREKQVCKKVSRHLEEHESYKSTRLRSFGDPFQLPKAR